jgi:hypothetical protein
MTDDVFYPVPGRSESFNHRLAGHEAGHALVGRSLGMKIWSVTIDLIADRMAVIRASAFVPPLSTN